MCALTPHIPIIVGLPEQSAESEISFLFPLLLTFGLFLMA